MGKIRKNILKIGKLEENSRNQAYFLFVLPMKLYEYTAIKKNPFCPNDPKLQIHFRNLAEDPSVPLSMLGLIVFVTSSLNIISFG